MWSQYIRYNDTYKKWLYVKWKLSWYGIFYVKYGKWYRVIRYFKWKPSVNGIFICQIWSVIKIEFIRSVETIVICVTIHNVSKKVEGSFILEIETLVIRETEIWHIKSLYTFRPARRPLIARSLPAHCPITARATPNYQDRNWFPDVKLYCIRLIPLRSYCSRYISNRQCSLSASVRPMVEVIHNSWYSRSR